MIKFIYFKTEWRMYTKRTISLCTICAILLCMNPLTTNAASISADDNVQKVGRIITIFNMYIEELETQANTLLELSGEDMINIQIERISTIYDFAGNEYTLVECNPSGYIIYHNESGVFVEASAVAETPFAECEGEKYYGGPNEYYVKKNVDGDTVYSHTKTDEVFCVDEIVVYAEQSELINDALIENENTIVLNYIDNNQGLDIANPAAVTYGDWTAVMNYRFFTSLTYPGETTINGKGICGYIAAAMILTYQQLTFGGNVVDSSYYTGNYTNGYRIYDCFPEDLYDIGHDLGYGTDTTSVAIHYTVKKYLEDRNISATHTSLYVPFAGNTVIESKILENRPVIWFGNIAENSFDNQKNINHAVVVYAYNYSLLGGYKYLAHFGWDNASMVTFSGILGSIYTFDIN